MPTALDGLWRRALASVAESVGTWMVAAGKEGKGSTARTLVVFVAITVLRIVSIVYGRNMWPHCVGLGSDLNVIF